MGIKPKWNDSSESVFQIHNHQSKSWLTWLYLLNCVQYFITLNIDWIFNEIYLHINIGNTNCFELRIVVVTHAQELVLEISPFYISTDSFKWQVITMTVLVYHLLWCSTVITDYYTVTGDVAFGHWTSLHPGRLGLGLLFSFPWFTRQRLQVRHCEMHPVSSAQETQLCFVDWWQATWISDSFLQKSENQMQTQLSEASWRYVEVLGGFGFQKLINELSLFPYADFL